VSSPSPARGLLAFLLGLVAVALLPLALAAHWADGVVGSTSTYLDTVSPLAKDPAVQQVAEQRIRTAILDNLPSSVVTLGGAQVKETVSTLSHTAVHSDVFPTAWDSANATAHQRLLSALQDATPTDKDVTIPLAKVVDAVLAKLSTGGIHLDITVPADAASVTLLPGSEMGKARLAYERLTAANTWLPWATGGAAVLALLVANRRFRALSWLGWGGALGALAVPVALTVIRQTTITHADGTAPRAVRLAVWDALTHDLRHEGFVVAGIAAAAAVVATLVAWAVRRS